MKEEIIASVAHSINAAYCRAMGDESQPYWKDAPQWQKDSALAGVNMHLDNPDATPEQSHESWLAQKVAEGWVYGEEKDAEAKTHPCCLPYDQLPIEQKAKDYIFREVVHAVSAALDAMESHATAVTVLKYQNRHAAPVSGGVPVKYIGRRETWTDRIYGTGLTYESGQVRTLPKAVAAKLLYHVDLFEQVEAASAEAPAQDEPADDTKHMLDEGAKQTEAKEEQAREFEIIDQVRQMSDKNTLADFAMTKYQIKLNKTKSVANLQNEVIELVNRYGVE